MTRLPWPLALSWLTPLQLKDWVYSRAGEGMFRGTINKSIGTAWLGLIYWFMLLHCSGNRMSRIEMKFYCIRFCHARHFFLFFSVFQPHSLLYPVQLQSMGSLLNISVRIRAGQIITTNQICVVSKKHIPMSPGFLCRSDAFVTKNAA